MNYTLLTQEQGLVESLKRISTFARLAETLTPIVSRHNKDYYPWME